MRLALLSADALSCSTAISDPQLPLVAHCDPPILHGLQRASNTAYALANAGPGTAHCNTNHQGGKNSVCRPGSKKALQNPYGLAYGLIMPTH